LIQIALIGENALTRGGVSAIVARQPDLEVVAEARSHTEVDRICQRVRPDMFVLDVPALRKETVDVARQISVQDRGVPRPILVVTASADDHTYDLLRLGSCTLMSRNSGPAELAACIRLVAAGYVIVERRHAIRLASGVRRFSANHDVEGHGLVGLTTREREVFALIAQGYSNNDIAEVLAVAISTVKSHVKEIYQKLGLKNRVEAALYVNANGVSAPE
jgi:DNA-binding NarL/FixJ family response regulator